MKNLEVELLRTHKTFSTPGTPTIWDYAEEYARAKGVLYSVDGIRLYYGPVSRFEKLLNATRAAEPAWHVEDQDWALAELNSGWKDAYAKFVVTPDGQIFSIKPGSVFFTTAIKVRRTTSRRPAGSYEPYYDVFYRYMTDTHDKKDDPYRKPEWARTRKILQLLEDSLFQAAWKSARSEWVREKKKSGEWEEASLRRKGKALADKTNKKMKACMQTKETIQALEQYLIDLNNNSATQRQVGELYQKMIELASTNKRIKGSFPKE